MNQLLLSIKKRAKGKQSLILLFTLYILCCDMAFSQNPFIPKINNLPTSPEVAMLGRFGDIPIGYYTGTASISVPIYTIKEAGVEIPITLDYHSSGIKVADEASWVGLGWNLIPEGTIVQEVRGMTDQADAMYQAACNADINYLFSKNRILTTGDYSTYYQIGRETAGQDDACLFCSSCSVDPYCIVDGYLHGKGEPDIYRYNFSGHSGSFFIDPDTHEIVLIDEKDKIIFYNNNENGWIAKTLDGNVFNFTVIETAYGGLTDEYSGITYMLSSISTNNGKDISFSYVDEKYYERIRNERANINTFDSGGTLPEEFFFHDTNHNKKTLSKITTSEVVIDFNLESREDFYSHPSYPVKRLKSIDIKSVFTNTKIKSFEFGYSYFPYNLVGTPTGGSGITDPFTAAHEVTLGKRLKLDSVREIGYSNGTAVTTNPPYLFEYDLTTTMPLKNSYATDFWGYYNGQYNTKQIPDLNYFDYLSKPQFQVINQGPLSYPAVLANRYTDNTKAGANMLKKITYPTGGVSEFEFESNSFTNQFIPDQNKAAAAYKLTVIEDNNLTGNITLKSFKLSKAATITFQNTINGNNVGMAAFTPAQLAGCYIKFYKVVMVGSTPNVTVIKLWNLSTVLNADFMVENKKVWDESLRIEYDSNPNLTYYVEVYMPDSLNNPLDYYHSAGVKSRFFYYDDTGVDTSISNQCGMRVKTIKNYANSNVNSLVSHKSISYFDGKLLNAFEPLSMVKANQKGTTFTSGGVTYEYIAFYKRITLSTDDFGANGGNLIGYGKVEETELANNGSINKGKKAFTYFNTTNATKKGLPIIANLRNGLILKEEVFNSLGNKLTEKNFNYINFSTSPTKNGIRAVRLSYGNVPCANSYTYPFATNSIVRYYDEGTNVTYNASQYAFDVYPINPLCIKLSDTQTNEFLGANTVTTSEAYTYNAINGKTSSVTTTNSKNETLITKYYYSDNAIVADPTMQAQMTGALMTGIPVYTEQWNGSELLSSQKTTYAPTGSNTTHGTSVLMPKYVYASKGSNALERKVSYNLYDNKANLLQYTLENNAPVSIIWGYNQTLPIAKIENADYSQASAAFSTNDVTFRSNLPNAMISTYTYLPLIGVNTITDPKGETTSYNYDAYGRPLNVKDSDGKILTENEYHYKN